MAAKMITLTVDFAGTREEARQFVNQHPDLHLAHKAGPAPDCLPMITIRCSSYAKRAKALELLASLGWDDGSVGESNRVYA
jgi:hypothetical protein